MFVCVREREREGERERERERESKRIVCVGKCDKSSEWNERLIT